MRFVYDADKSEANERKHGIDFETVQELWWGPVVTAPSPRKGEMRYISIGRIAGEYWSVIHAQHGELLRIISARRATKEERSRFDKGNHS